MKTFLKLPLQYHSNLFDSYDRQAFWVLHFILKEKTCFDFVENEKWIRTYLFFATELGLKINFSCVYCTCTTYSSPVYILETGKAVEIAYWFLTVFRLHKWRDFMLAALQMMRIWYSTGKEIRCLVLPCTKLSGALLVQRAKNRCKKGVRFEIPMCSPKL